MRVHLARQLRRPSLRRRCARFSRSRWRSANYAATRPGTGSCVYPGAWAPTLPRVRDIVAAGHCEVSRGTRRSSARGDQGLGRQERRLVLVVGTAAEIWPAAGFVVHARKQGAALAVVNTDTDNLGSARDLKPGDFYFIRDSVELLPRLFEPLANTTS
ncbi:hypothetical protein ANO14919_140060 [Xylariales sp. No.14919]|nr:hypothetical protein ANO14919_140060 [Xylariales sp. No.14919]